MRGLRFWNVQSAEIRSSLPAILVARPDGASLKEAARSSKVACPLGGDGDGLPRAVRDREQGSRYQQDCVFEVAISIGKRLCLNTIILRGILRMCSLFFN